MGPRPFGFMHYVYLLKSINKSFLYVGTTSDLKRRLVEHNTGRSFATKTYAPFKLVYYEAYAHKKDSDLRERMLKHHGSVIGHLKRRVKNSLNV